MSDNTRSELHQVRFKVRQDDSDRTYDATIRAACHSPVDRWKVLDIEHACSDRGSVPEEAVL